MHVAVLQPLVGHWPGNLAPWALLLLLKACGISTKLAVPVHADKAVVKDRFCAGYGSSGFFILCVLDQCCLWVSAKHNLDWECTCKSVNVLNSFSCRPNLYELCGEHSLKKAKQQQQQTKLDAFYLYIDDGSKLAEVLVEFGDVVELTRDPAHLQLCVHVKSPLGKSTLMLVVEARPKKNISVLTSLIW